MLSGSEQAQIADPDPLSDGKKRRISCQYSQLAEIQDTESIPKPHLLAEIYTIWQNWSPEEFKEVTCRGLISYLALKLGGSWSEDSL